MEIQKTFRELREFNMATQSYFRRNPTALSTKLGYALKRVGERELTPILTDYNKERDELYYDTVQRVSIDNALTDSQTGAILSAPKDSERPYLYNPEGLKVVLEAEHKFNYETQKELLEKWDKMTFPIKSYIATDIPTDLTDEEIDAFRGLVIPTDYVHPILEEKVTE